MKRLYIAIFFIILASVLSISECIFIDMVYDDYTSKIEKCKDYVYKKDYNTAKIIASDIELNWNKEISKLNIFLNHSDIKEISDSIYNIENLMNPDTTDEFFEQCEKTKRQLLSLKESELPYLENII